MPRLTSLIAVVWFASFLSTANAQYNVKNMIEEGRSCLATGEYLVSMHLLNRIAILKPYLYEPWYLMAQAKYHLEDYDGSIHDSSKAIELNPYIPEMLDLRAMSYIQKERYDSAAVDYTRAIELSPDNSNYWFNRAWCYDRANQRELSRSQLEYIIRRWPSLSQAKQLLRELNGGKKRSLTTRQQVLSTRRLINNTQLKP